MTAVLARRLVMSGVTMLFVYLIVGTHLFWLFVPREGWIFHVAAAVWANFAYTCARYVWHWSGLSTTRDDFEL